MRLILASSSQRRIDLLARINYKPDLIISPDIDETPINKELPRILSKRLSILKAQEVAKSYQNDLVIAADTVVSCGRFILPKALNEEDARLCLNKLSGRRHRVYTSVCGIYNKSVISKTALSIVKFKVMHKKEIEDYVQSKEWYGKSGGYAIQGIASAYVLWISGTESNIIGLPIPETYTILNHFNASMIKCI